MTMRDKDTPKCVFEGCTRNCASKHKSLCPGHETQKRRGKELKPLADYVRRESDECGFEGCNEPYHAKGYCHRHAAQKRAGKTLTPITSKKSEPKECSFEGCERFAIAKGLCKTHAEQKRRGKTLTAIQSKKSLINKDKPCSFEGCKNWASSDTLCRTHAYQKSAGKTLMPIASHCTCYFEGCEEPVQSNNSNYLCRGHFSQEKRGVRLTPLVKNQKNKGKNCSFGYCKKAAVRKGLCGSHASQLKRGKPLTAIGTVKTGRPSTKEEGRSYDKDGYVMVSVRRSNGKIRNMGKHRLVMEEHIGRELLPHETVHHKNGVRHDNRLKNLELWSGSHPPGQRVKDKLDWAYEIIELYEKERKLGKV